MTTRIPCKPSSATIGRIGQLVLHAGAGLLDAAAKHDRHQISTGTSARMNSVRLAFSVSTIAIAPISVTTWLSSVVILVVSIVRIWVTSLDSRETRSPTRRSA